MKKIIVVTGGAGFVGSNLINFLLNNTTYKIISIDDYSSGFRKNHIKHRRIRYIKSHTKNISNVLKRPKNINTIFHFGEFARIYQSFVQMNKCLNFSGELITSIKIFEEELELTRRVLATSNFELIEIADVDNVQISETWKHAITNDYLRLEIGKQDGKDTSEPPATLKDVVDELLDLWIELRAIRNSITITKIPVPTTYLCFINKF